jgi:hypothetical protein
MKIEDLDQAEELAKTLCTQVVRDHPELVAKAQSSKELEELLKQPFDEARLLFRQQVAAPIADVFWNQVWQAAHQAFEKAHPERVVRTRDMNLIRKLAHAIALDLVVFNRETIRKHDSLEDVHKALKSELSNGRALFRRSPEAC